jgi:hypothetical protein
MMSSAFSRVAAGPRLFVPAAADPDDEFGVHQELAAGELGKPPSP